MFQENIVFPFNVQNLYGKHSGIFVFKKYMAAINMWQPFYLVGWDKREELDAYYFWEEKER